MKRRIKNLVAGAAVGATLLGGVAFFFYRRLHKITFIPDPPSRSLNTAEWQESPSFDSLRILYVGHSLIGTEAPAMAGAVARSLGIEWSHDVQLTDGGSLEVNWNRAQEAAGVNAAEALDTGDYDVVVLTEAVILDDHLRWSDSSGYADLFYQRALASRDDIRLLFFEGWHDRHDPRTRFGLTTPPEWRLWIDDDLGKWESIVDGTSMHEQVRIIPGGQAMARLSDALEGGEIPGDLALDAFFVDGVHLSALGNYYMALVHVSAIARRSPVGATNRVPHNEGEGWEIPADVAEALQELAWRCVRGYPRSGVLHP
jgi:hypothetical protein